MTKRVLDAGNCSLDHTAVRRLIEEHFDAEVAASRGREDTLELLESERFDLVLVNRILDGDGASGIELIRQIKGSSEWSDTPVMLITNFAEHQTTAEEAGAEPGFGKRTLKEPATREMLAKFLS